MKIRTTIGNKLLIGFVSVLSAILFAGCATSSDPEKAALQTPYGLLLQDAATYVDGLRVEDKLPGIRKGDHGSLMTIPEPVWDKGVTYPVTVVVRGTKKDADFLYRYTLLKSDSKADWQLIEATSWDKEGRVVEQLLPK
jgi:hypothetical protein